MDRTRKTRGVHSLPGCQSGHLRLWPNKTAGRRWTGALGGWLPGATPHAQHLRGGGGGHDRPRRSERIWHSQESFYTIYGPPYLCKWVKDQIQISDIYIYVHFWEVGQR